MARDPLTLDAVVCASCGTRFKRDRDRCPRCRARPAVVDPAAVAASSRRLARIGASVMVVGVMGVAGVWLLAPEAKTSVPTGPVVDPLAARRAAAHTPDVAPAPAPAPAERPFMDPVGAAYESYQAGDFGSALKHYQEAAARNPQDPEALSNLGQVLVRLGRVAEALPYFSKALELNPDRWTYQFNRARAEGLLEHWTECIAGYRRAQQLFPNDYATAYNLALALHRSGDDEGAVGELRAARNAGRCRQRLPDAAHRNDDPDRAAHRRDVRCRGQVSGTEAARRTMAIIGNGAQSEFQAIAFKALTGVDRLQALRHRPVRLAKCAKNLAGMGFDITICADRAGSGARRRDHHDRHRRQAVCHDPDR